MRYLSRMHLDDEVKELTADEARRLLEGFYKQKFVRDLFKNGTAFRLFTRYREIWTVDEQGRVPVAGFYGTVG